MRKLNLFLMLVMLGFGMMNVQTAEPAGTTVVTDAPCEGTTMAGGATPVRPFLDNGNCDVGPQWNARIAIAPYAQVIAGNSYTFIGVSHPSLATAHTSIGVVVEALNMVTVPNTSAGRAAVFTVSAGETHRVFVVNQGHDTINANNSAFTDSKTHLITTTDGSQFGSIKVWGIGTAPNRSSLSAKRPGWYTGAAENDLLRFDNLNQLAMWGVVYQTSNGSGFAMEFVGDMHDSSSAGSTAYPSYGATAIKSNSSGFGRGIN